MFKFINVAFLFEDAYTVRLNAQKKRYRISDVNPDYEYG